MALRLSCPECGTSHEGAGRFCPSCGMPLTLPEGAEPPLTERQERARKVLPQYGEGALTKVGWARNQPEAEMLSGMLLEEGIPSVIRRSGGFDVPDFLAAGPRDILVAASGADAARDVLRAVAPGAGAAPAEGGLPGPAARHGTPAWVRALAVVLVAVTVAIVLAGVVAALL